MLRRDLIQSALAAAVQAPQPSLAPNSEGLAAYENASQIIVRWNNSTLTVYRAHPSQKFPYFYPLAGPATGISLTTESSLPWPHHRGLWLGCDRVNGGDYWSDGPLEKGHIRSVGLRLDLPSRDRVVIADRCEWVRKDAPSPFEDERRFTIARADNRYWTLDAEIRLIARTDVAVPKTNHSFFSMRCAPEISHAYGGRLVNSEGDEGEKGTFGKPARWCSFHGPRSGVVEGITLVDHPKNPWAPCPWFTRDYGFASPTPLFFHEKPWTLAKGESITFRYRVVCHAGPPVGQQISNVLSMGSL